jgi:hypothetical protein
MNLAISALHSVIPAKGAVKKIGVYAGKGFTADGPSPPFRGEREGPRRDSAGQGEVGSAANCLNGPPSPFPLPPAGGGRGF